MKEIIETAKAKYPNDGTQQFYRVIRFYLEEIMATDTNLQNEHYETTNGINVVKQYFHYNNNDYLYWVCQFPVCSTDNGKKKAYYGIEKKENRIWQLLWTEIDLDSKDNVLSNWSLLLKMRIAVKTDAVSSLYAINPFEKAIEKAPYNSDIFEQGNIICKIMTDYVNTGACDFFRQKKVVISNGEIRFSIFKLYGTVYTWSEFYKDGRIECFQLDAQYENNIALNLFANMENTEPLTAEYIANIISAQQ